MSIEKTGHTRVLAPLCLKEKPTQFDFGKPIKMEENIMYARPLKLTKTLPVKYQCQDCEEFFSVDDHAAKCPNCFAMHRSNLIILHMEDDQDRIEWLELVDFSAGD